MDYFKDKTVKAKTAIFGAKTAAEKTQRRIEEIEEAKKQRRRKAHEKLLDNTIKDYDNEINTAIEQGKWEINHLTISDKVVMSNDYHDKERNLDIKSELMSHYKSLGYKITIETGITFNSCSISWKQPEKVDDLPVADVIK